MAQFLGVISADSGAALLKEQFQPTHIVASISVVMEPLFEVIVKEAELCLRLLGDVKAGLVHRTCIP